jgi:hypothetical protein
MGFRKKIQFYACLDLFLVACLACQKVVLPSATSKPVNESKTTVSSEPVTSNAEVVPEVVNNKKHHIKKSPASVIDPKPVTVAEVKPVTVAEVKPVTVAEVKPVTVAEVKPVTVAEVKPVTVAEVKPVTVAPPVALAKPVCDNPLDPQPEFYKRKITMLPPVEDLAQISHLFLGVGVNYTRYEETLSDLDTSYNNFKAPTYHMGGYFALDAESGLDFFYKSINIDFDNSSISKSDTSGQWDTAGVHYDFRKIKNSETMWNMSIGAQMHQMPLALFKNSNNQPVIKNIQLLDISVGAQYKKYFDSKTRGLWEMHYQHPIDSSASTGGAKFSIDPQLAFDGSIGLEKSIFNRAGDMNKWLGLYWYGQYHKVNFKYSDGEVTATGTHQTMFSTVELRFSYEF